MTDNQAESSTAATSSATTPTASTSNPVNESQLRQRFAKSQPPPSPASFSAKARRRSSILSFTSLEGTSSIHEDIINPTSPRNAKNDHEITHWSSTPLAFAILPAVAGLFVTDGSAFVTDVILLGLAAVFMNWSIRVPREWYYTAQAVRKDVAPRSPTLDEDEDEEAIDESDEPKESTAEDVKNPRDNAAREAASTQLRRQEILALIATFIMPAAAAYLLHVIRAQLSRPSTSLVTDYNLSIFLLAAEFWPARQVIRLIAARTLHLQRTASGLDDPFADSLAKATSDSEGLLARIEALESQLAGQTLLPETTNLLQPSDLVGLDSRIQKRLEPRLDSLERAVRRYEKRYTTLAMVTEQRFQSLETRLQDALSLAAVAAQHSQSQGGVLRTALSATQEIVLLPAKLAWELIVWPCRVVDEIYSRFKVLMLGPRATKPQSAKRKVNRHLAEARSKDEKLLVREKGSRKATN